MDSLILVGHSFGASMILKYLSENTVPNKLNGIFLIATPFWSGNEDWIKGLRLKDNFTQNLPEAVPVYFYHAKDDDEIPLSHLYYYKEKIIRAKFRVIDHGDHQFNNALSIVGKDINNLNI